MNNKKQTPVFLLGQVLLKPYLKLTWKNSTMFFISKSAKAPIKSDWRFRLHSFLTIHEFRLQIAWLALFLQVE